MKDPHLARVRDSREEDASPKAGSTKSTELRSWYVDHPLVVTPRRNETDNIPPAPTSTEPGISTGIPGTQGARDTDPADRAGRPASATSRTSRTFPLAV